MGCDMPDYRRFITYLFEYRDGKKEKNCGFAKVEIRQKNCRIEIQMKGIMDGEVSVYLFQRKDKSPEGILIGKILLEKGWGKGIFVLVTDQIGESACNMQDMCGLYLKQNETDFIASQWDDIDTDWSAFKIYEKETNEPKTEGFTEEKEQKEKVIIREGKNDEIRNEEIRSEKIKNKEIKDKKEDVTQTDSEPEIHTTQTACANQTNLRLSYERVWEQQWQKFAASHPIFLPFDDASDIWGVRMQLSDLKILPKSYWNLANNSFLLHGYFNYRYVLFGYMESQEGKNKRWFLGVPGVFQNQERILAGIFGFPEFRTKQAVNCKTGEFGYWYQFLF